MQKLKLTYICWIIILQACAPSGGNKTETESQPSISAVNEKEIPLHEGTIAITHTNMIDGVGEKVQENVCVIVKNGLIETVGDMDEVSIPEEAEIIDGKGKYLLPGLIDAHFHLDNLTKYPNIFLTHGITSLRDPGAWIEAYQGEREAGYALPRLFLTGPHLDMFPPAYPKNSYIIRDKTEARAEVEHLVSQGASAIKVYFRLSLGLIQEVCETAHEHGIPVTAHLEITDAKEAILAGLDGIEHVTSFGTTLMGGMKAEAYRQSVLADNQARRNGRYEVWQSLDINGMKVDSLLAFLVEHQTYLCPTLGAFEYRFSPDKTDTIKQEGYANMMTFMQKAYQKGVNIVVGSHSYVPYSQEGWAYHHEMELFQEFGMQPIDIIKSATLQNARFFRVEDRLGSIEKGKMADLLMLNTNPLEDISALRDIHRVMLNGQWIAIE